MKALVATKLGTTEVLQIEDIQKPETGPNDLLIEVYATAMNPVDVKARQHGLGGMLNPPFVLGYDVSGVVRATGTNAATKFAIGDEVYGYLSLARNGANAEFVAADYRVAAHKPAKLTHVEAAALPLALVTAWEGLYNRLNIQAGETVLIQAGGGGVGHLAIQLAKLKGAKVITTASSDASIQLAKELSADVVINHREEDFVERVNELTEKRGVTAIFDCVGSTVFDRSLDCLATSGRIATIVEGGTASPSHKLFIKNATLHYVFAAAAALHNLQPEKQGAILEAAAELATKGKLRAHVSQVFSLDQLAEAHKIQETGKVTGKIGITVRN